MRSAEVCWSAAILSLAAITTVAGHSVGVPANFTALSGDLRVTINRTDFDAPARLEVVRMTSNALVVLGYSPVKNLSEFAYVPCKLFSQGGRYGVRLVRANESDPGDLSDLVALDVRWPTAHLSMDTEHVATYPNRSVTATLEFASNRCRFPASSGVPEFVLELLYCGHSPLGCAQFNSTLRQVLHSEPVRGYPRRRVVTLGCELFGLDGFYALSLRALSPTAQPLNVTAFLRASWSDKFVFNVFARSIFPCDTHGGGVETVFQYPACRAPVGGAGDRVRLFARLRADVASLHPPTSLHYVAEQRVAPGQHHLHFDCDLFAEKYIEYCFVYVSQAVTGAMADVRMDCVPTLPVADSDSGGWGEWSVWTPCTTTCPGGVRTRFRFCDSPPPRYGAKYCDGNSTEKSSCGGPADVWDCPFDPSVPIPADRPEILAEVGPGCRCGCVVHLGAAKPRRVLATSAQACVGRAFWLIQAEPGHVVRLSIEHLRLPCAEQVLLLRDGDSLGSPLIAQLSGSPRGPPKLVTSDSNHLLMEFLSDDITCGGGFLAHAQQIPPQHGNWSTQDEEVGAAWPEVLRLSTAHALGLLFVGVMFLLTAGLASQYLFRYHKYNLAVAELDGRSRATSRTTLLSEVISLARGVGVGVGVSRTHVALVEEDDEDDSETEYEPVPTSNLHARARERDIPARVRATSASEKEDPRAEVGLITGKPKRATKGERRKSVDGDADADKDVISKAPSSGSSRRLSCARTLSGANSVASGVGSSTSVATLTNASLIKATPMQRGVASPLPGATAKRNKDRRNLERLLQGATSEFSLGGAEASDLELDYYDYNVSNAGAVPGSFLGMDPAYLVWIPPFAPRCWDTDDDLLNMAADNSSGEGDHEMQELANRTLSSPPSDAEQSTELSERPIDGSDNRSVVEVRVEGVKTPLARVRHRMRGEKETRVEKSPAGDTEYYDLLNDIKFADDEDEEAADAADGDGKRQTPAKKRFIKA